MHEDNLEKILFQGQEIEAKLNERKNWMKAVIYKVYESIIEIEFSEDDSSLDDFIAIGDSVNCRFSKDQCEYVIDGWVSRIKSDSPQRLTIQSHRINKNEKFENESSYNIFFGCILRVDPKDKGIFSIAKKISKHSIVIAYKKDLNLKDKIYLELLLPENVTFKAIIEAEDPDNAAKGKDFKAKIVDQDALNSRILDNFLVELKNAEPDKYNKQDSFWKKNSKVNI